MKYLLHGILASSLILSMGTITFATELAVTTGNTEVLQEIQLETLSTGTCGENSTWSFSSSTGTLTIAGTGDLDDFSGTSPWYEHYEKIKSVVIHDGITNISAGAFQQSTHLTSVTIPDSVTSIGRAAFAHCTSLTSFHVPASVTSIDVQPFWDCSALSQITVSEQNPSFSAVDGVLFNKNKTELHAFPIAHPDRAYTIPSSVTTIIDNSFALCENLTSLTIPDSVTTIERCAFAMCTGLTSISIPDSVTELADFAFGNCASLGEVSLSNSITILDEYTFGGCSSLLSITIPNSVTSIGQSAFASCSSLKEVIIGNSVTEIGHNAFILCESLTTVSLPLSVASIGGYAFADCDSLKTVNYQGSQTEQKKIDIDDSWDGNVSLENATWVYNHSEPIWSGSTSKTATPSTAKVMVNGELVNFGAYNIDGFNFYKLTDMSFALNGSGKQFEVTWDGEIGAINMKMGSPHIVLGSELEGTSENNAVAEEMDVKVLKNSALVDDLIVYSIDGSSYFQLDKLKGVLGIDVGWDGATSTITITT